MRARSHPWPATAVLALVPFAIAAGIPAPAQPQCVYPTLLDGVPQTFSTTPGFPRFVQASGRWAAVGV